MDSNGTLYLYDVYICEPMCIVFMYYVLCICISIYNGFCGYYDDSRVVGWESNSHIIRFIVNIICRDEFEDNLWNRNFIIMTAILKNSLIWIFMYRTATNWSIISMISGSVAACFVSRNILICIFFYFCMHVWSQIAIAYHFSIESGT